MKESNLDEFYDSNYMTFWKRSNYGDSRLPQAERKKDEQRAQRIFRAVHLLYDSIVQDWTCVSIYLSKPTEQTSRVTLNASHGGWIDNDVTM